MFFITLTEKNQKQESSQQKKTQQSQRQHLCLVETLVLTFSSGWKIKRQDFY